MLARRRVPFCLVTLALFLAPAAGCRSASDLVEAELRSLEKDLRDIKEELFRSEAQNDALQRELSAVRKGPTSAAKPTPEQASQTYTLKSIAIARGTGGYDEDGVPGDEALQLVLEPRDADGHAIKAPGSLTVQALEITVEGLKTPLDIWEVPPEQLRKKWHSGLLTHGYQVILPWRNWPTSEKLRVVARFTLADGRAYEAERDITIRLTTAARRKSVPLLPGEAPVIAPPGIDIPLPPPRKVEPDVPMASPASLQRPIVRDSAVEPAEWKPKKPTPLNEAVELLRPVPLAYPPGQPF